MLSIQYDRDMFGEYKNTVTGVSEVKGMSMKKLGATDSYYIMSLRYKKDNKWFSISSKFVFIREVPIEAEGFKYCGNSYADKPEFPKSQNMAEGTIKEK